MGMLPKSFPAFPDRDDIALAAKIVPAKEVGGDLYDFFIENDKLYFIVGDVSGKGIPASLVMAVTCRLFRSIASFHDKPEEIITSLNDSLSDGNESNMFCTAFLGILDLKTGHLDYCNAGHNAPLVIGSNGNVSAIPVEPNLPLGLFGGFPYQGQETNLGKGTMLYLFTDGVNEAEDMEMNQFGDDRLVSLLEKNAGAEPKEIVETTFAQVQLHADGANQSDDITVMCIKICQ
jgi:sigma-B regulation protein RsbU (phosphoserine phosphatase)